MKSQRPTAPGLGPEPGAVRRGTGDARGCDLLDVSEIRLDFVALLAVFETTLRKQARRGV